MANRSENDGGTRKFVVELYLSGSADSSFVDVARRARSAAEEMTREGTPVRFVRSLFARDDETCFHVYEAPSLEAAREVSRRAAIERSHVVEVLEVRREDALASGERRRTTDQGGTR